MAAASASAASRVEVLVCGAGVVGLAIARAFARAGKEVLVVEAEHSFGTQTSSRNSEVVHAGLYYPKGSLKARLCVEGRQRLYHFCKTYAVPHRRVGKLIVATEASHEATLRRIEASAVANGVRDLRHITKDEARALEPRLHCTQALLSPSTGLIDSHSLMLALLGDAEHHGANIAYHAPITQTQVHMVGGLAELRVEVGGMVLCPSLLINSAGLNALPLARTLSLPPPTHNTPAPTSSASRDTGGPTQAHHPREEAAPSPLAIAGGSAGARGGGREALASGWRSMGPLGLLPPTARAYVTNLPSPHYCKGNYFKLQGVSSPFRRLVYPVPEAAGLGIHATLDLAGCTRFGPDVQWTHDPQDLSVDPHRATHFKHAISRYWPGVLSSSVELVPDYAGIRPKLQAPSDKGAVDFRVDGPSVHGLPLVNLLGIESPGLTSCLALARHVLQLTGVNPSPEPGRQEESGGGEL